MAVIFSHKGNFKKLDGFFERAKEVVHKGDLNKYGEEGVAALMAATPKDSGNTAMCWYYEIEHAGPGVKLSFHNSNMNQGLSIAILLQYGHGTGTGGHVEGIDYINPALKPVFERIAMDAWKEVTKL